MQGCTKYEHSTEVTLIKYTFMSKVMEESRHSSTTYFLPVTKGKKNYSKRRPSNLILSLAMFKSKPRQQANVGKALTCHTGRRKT
jgi:hypothetical protein